MLFVLIEDSCTSAGYCCRTHTEDLYNNRFQFPRFPLTFLKPIAIEGRQATDIASQFGNFPTTVPRFSTIRICSFFSPPLQLSFPLFLIISLSLSFSVRYEKGK